MEVLVLMHASFCPMTYNQIFYGHWAKNCCFLFTIEGSFQLLPFEVILVLII
jgi:hypothetical protein